MFKAGAKDWGLMAHIKHSDSKAKGCLQDQGEGQAEQREDCERWWAQERWAVPAAQNDAIGTDRQREA